MARAILSTCSVLEILYSRHISSSIYCWVDRYSVLFRWYATSDSTIVQYRNGRLPDFRSGGGLARCECPALSAMASRCGSGEVWHLCLPTHDRDPCRQNRHPRYGPADRLTILEPRQPLGCSCSIPFLCRIDGCTKMVSIFLIFCAKPPPRVEREMRRGAAAVCKDATGVISWWPSDPGWHLRAAP